MHAIRSAPSGDSIGRRRLALAALAVPTILRGENFGVWFAIIAILLVVHSFVPTAANG